MNPGEHEIMSRVEERHWWYQGLRDALARTLADAALPERPRILDAGCGTGQNLRFLSERLDPGYLGGFDLSEEALAFTRSKVPDADLYVGDICEPQIHPDELDMVISMDVVYIPGTERALPGLRRLVARLSPGGLFVDPLAQRRSSA